MSLKYFPTKINDVQLAIWRDEDLGLNFVVRVLPGGARDFIGNNTNAIWSLIRTWPCDVILDFINFCEKELK